MSNKIIYLGLTIIIVISILLVGCTKEQVIKDTETKASTEAASQDNDETEIENNNENSVDNQDGIYEITMETYTEKNEKVEIEIKYPALKNMADTDIENKINTIIKKRTDDYKQLYHAEDEGYKETIHVDYEMMREKEDMLSLRFFISLYTEGAAHPNNLMDGVTLDLKTGEELELSNLFKEDIDYVKALNPILKEKVNELEYELFEEYKGIEEEQGFYMTDNSLVVYYQTYVYTPHAVGPLLLEVSLDEIKDILK